MGEQPPLNAATFLFKRRERNFVLTGAAVAYYLAVIAVTGVFLALTWGFWGQLIAWYFDAIRAVTAGSEPTLPPPELISQVAPFYLAFLPISLLLFAAFEAACLRWLVRGEAGGGVLGLKLDADTWRVFAIYWVWFAYFVLAAIGVALFYTLVAMLGSVGGVAQMLAILIGALAPIGIAALLIWGGVLFAPAAATSIGARKLSFLSARKVSRPRFWPLLTAFFLVVVSYLVLATVVSTILQIPLNIAMAPVTHAVLRGGDGAEVLQVMQEAMLTPTMIGVLAANIVVSLILATICYLAMFGVNARAFEVAAEAGDVARG